MKTPNQILEAIRELAPSVSVTVQWSHDDDAKFDGELSDGDDPANWQAWNADVRATAIIRGITVSGNDRTGGTWIKVGDHPEVSDPDIDGYLPQMLETALKELAVLVPLSHSELLMELAAAFSFVTREIRERYAEQQAKVLGCGVFRKAAR